MTIVFLFICFLDTKAAGGGVDISYKDGISLIGTIFLVDLILDDGYSIRVFLDYDF